MKKFVFVLLFALSSLFSQEKYSDTMVGKVDQAVITEKMLMSIVDFKMSRNFFHGSVEGEQLEKLKKETLQAMIDRELIHQYADRNGYALSPEELKKEEQVIVDAFGSRDNFKMALSRSKLDYDMFKYELIRDKSMFKVYEAKLKSDYTEEDLQTFYDENMHKFKKPELISVQIIYIKNNPTDVNGTQKVKSQIEEALALIESGEDFGVVAAEYSNDMSRVKGGVIKNVSRGMIDQTLEEHAFALKVGEMSGVIEQTVGSYLIKVTDRKPAEQMKFDDVKDKLASDIKTIKEKEALNMLLEKLKSYSMITNTLEKP